MQNADIGLIGLAVMGENLALNMERNGFRVALYNRPHQGVQAVDRFMEQRGEGRNFMPAYTLASFVASLERPRKVMMMIKAGAPVDEMIAQLLPLLEPGDIVIDGGNSDYRDTIRRLESLRQKGILFVGTGISGGEEGALLGPSMMPGGNSDAWPMIQPVFEKIAAKANDGAPCCAWMGDGGAGHFVKMVHNGIEYGDMQLIAEAYHFLKQRYGLSNNRLASLFAQWNQGPLKSYLIEISARIFAYKEASGAYLLDQILDSAGQKGSGKWTVSGALDLGDPLPLIAEAVFARFLSGMKEERSEAAKHFGGETEVLHEASDPDFTAVEQALYAAKIVSYAQGFSLLRRASAEFGWNLEMGTIAKIWRAGCIIRSAFLDDITEAYRRNPHLNNLLFADFFKEKIKAALPVWRTIAAYSLEQGTAMPCLVSALSYFDGLRTEHSPANLIQAQRDYFGAHTYERVDAERGKAFHTEWGTLSS